MICDRLVFAASRGFAADEDDLKSLMRRISADGRSQLCEGFPSKDTVRSFRARHRDITYRATDNNDLARLKGEKYEHLKTYATALRQVDSDFPEILRDPGRIWNMDETSVTAEFGMKTKSFVSSKTHHGGFKSVSTGKVGEARYCCNCSFCIWSCRSTVFSRRRKERNGTMDLADR